MADKRAAKNVTVYNWAIYKPIWLKYKLYALNA